MTYGIIANPAKPEVLPVLATLVAALKSSGSDFLIHDETAAAGGTTGVPLSAVLDAASMVVVLGGDGTMLSVARSIGARKLPLLGVNVGKLGFLADVSVGELERCLADIAAGRYEVEDRLALEAEAGGEAAPLTALNEITIGRGASARVIDFETFVDGEYLATYAADGILVTTPTGSTGYSLAAGGPIVTPRSDVLTIVAISPHTLTARPVIIPSDSRISVHVREGPPQVHVTADGQVERFFSLPFECAIRRAPFTVRLVRWSRGSYFDLLRTKLMWGRDLRSGRERRR